MCERCNSNKPSRLYLVRKGDRDYERRLCDDCRDVTKAVYKIKALPEAGLEVDPKSEIPDTIEETQAPEAVFPAKRTRTRRTRR